MYETGQISWLSFSIKLDKIRNTFYVRENNYNEDFIDIENDEDEELSYEEYLVNTSTSTKKENYDVCQ